MHNQVVTLVRGRWVLSHPEQGDAGLREHAAVAIDDTGQIVAVDPFNDLRAQYPHARVEGSANDLILPGFVDAHSHGMGLSYFELGLGYDHLESWNLSLPTVQRPDPYLDSLWCAIKHLRSGCTTIHHMGGAAEAPIQAYRELGIRWAFSLTVKNKHLITYDDDAFADHLPPALRERARPWLSPDSERLRAEYLEHFESIHSGFHAPEHPVLFGPMGPQWCSEGLLRCIARRARDENIRIHMHGIQTPYQRDALPRRRGMTGVEYLESLDLLGEHLTLGHGVWVNESDIERLAASGTSLTHHASCNLQMRNGILPLTALQDQGIPVAIGIDGKGINDDEDMMQEMRLIEKLHRIADLRFGAPLTVTPERILSMATVNGAATLGMEGIIGRLAPGYAADLLVVDLTPRPWMHPENSPLDQVVMERRREDIRTVMVQGQVVVRNGQIPGLDEEALLSALIDSISGPSDRSSDARLFQELKPYVQDFYRRWDEEETTNSPGFYQVNRR